MIRHTTKPIHVRLTIPYSVGLTRKTKNDGQREQCERIEGEMAGTANTRLYRQKSIPSRPAVQLRTRLRDRHETVSRE